MPAPNLVLNDVLLTTIQGLLFGQRTITTFHWKVIAVGIDVPVTSVATAMATEILPDFVLMISEDWSCDITTVRRIFPGPTRTFSHSPGTVAGAIADDSLPPSVTGVISRYGNGAARTNRGRIYVPGVPEGWHLAGQLTTAGFNAYTSFRPFLDLPLVSPLDFTLDPVLLRRPATTTLIEGSIARKILRQQRRREIGVGI